MVFFMHHNFGTKNVFPIIAITYFGTKRDQCDLWTSRHTVVLTTTWMANISLKWWPNVSMGFCASSTPDHTICEHVLIVKKLSGQTIVRLLSLILWSSEVGQMCSDIRPRTTVYQLSMVRMARHFFPISTSSRMVCDGKVIENSDKVVLQCTVGKIGFKIGVPF